MGRINSFGNSVTIDDTVRKSVAGTAITVGALPAGANGCTIRVIANAAKTDSAPAINKSTTGVPTASTGMPLWNGDVYEMYPDELTTTKFISADGLTHTICIEFNRLS